MSVSPAPAPQQLPLPLPPGPWRPPAPPAYVRVPPLASLTAAEREQWRALVAGLAAALAAARDGERAEADATDAEGRAA